MLDYDREAARYDDTRGGEPRARSAADAVLSLVPTTATTLLDVACGTGIVTAHVRRPGLRVFGADRSAGMAGYAVRRIGAGRVALADCTALPMAAGTLDAVTAIWLLHLIDDVAGMIAEAARVLRPGGVLITTVDKDAAHDVATDVEAVLRPSRHPDPSDKAETVRRYGADHGLYDAGSATFIGHGQGRTPRSAAANLRGGHVTSAVRAGASEREALAATLERLPGQDLPRPDPRYRLMALRKT